MKVDRQLPPTSRPKNRMVLSCAPCRRRKVKCDRARPCNQCIRSGIVNACDYSPRTPPANALPRQSPSPSPVSSLSPRPMTVSASTYLHRSPRLDQARDPSTLNQSAGWQCNTHRTAEEASSVNVPHCPLSLLESSALGHSRPPGMHKASTQPQSFLSFRGKQQRTRFFGRSHWATTLQMVRPPYFVAPISLPLADQFHMQFPGLMDHLQDYRRMKEGPSAFRFEEYLVAKRYKKSRRPAVKHCLESSPRRHKARFRDLLPSRQLADYLTHLYLSHYERTFRVVHVPSFLQEWAAFWNPGPTPPDEFCATEIFLAKVLTMMACASCIADDEAIALAGSDRSSLSQNCRDWIQAVISLIGPVSDHARLNLDLIQVKCLLIIARQATAYEGDLVGIIAGSLVREATMVGLHRDPAHFPNMSPFQAEIRKRLWLTVVELELQTVLHLGVPLALSWEDFDCPPPSNIDDEEFSVDSLSLAPEQPITTSTRTTFQIVLARTLSVRMEIAGMINRIRLDINTTETMRLSDALTSNLAEAPAELHEDHYSNDTTDSTSSWATFQKSFYLFLMWRSMLALHRPILLKLADVQNELFLISRRTCVQTSVALLAQLESFSDISHSMSSYPGRVFRPHVLRLRGGLFQDDVFHAAITVCYELRLQLKDSRTSPFTGPISNLITQSASYHRLALFQSIENGMQYFENKVRWEARACKSFSILYILFMTIKSQFPTHTMSANSDERCEPKPLTVDEACSKASRHCLEVLLEGERMRHLIETPDDETSHDAPPPNVSVVSCFVSLSASRGLSTDLELQFRTQFQTG
ncbi:unnamed protein product [Penicillium olsonii]|nr:unnamed protein product [Penicillium olsonii]